MRRRWCGDTPTPDVRRPALARPPSCREIGACQQHSTDSRRHSPLRLLGEAPTEAISQALDSLSTAELRALKRHITSATQQWRHQPDGTADGL